MKNIILNQRAERDELMARPYDWDLWVNKLYRRGKNLIITGSNAKMLSSEMATVLTGRYLQIKMLPFSLGETMRWKNVNPNLEEQSAQAIVVTDDYMRNGGYPETIQSRNITKSYLSTLFDSILLNPQPTASPSASPKSPEDPFEQKIFFFNRCQ